MRLQVPVKPGLHVPVAELEEVVHHSGIGRPHSVADGHELRRRDVRRGFAPKVQCVGEGLELDRPLVYLRHEVCEGTVCDQRGPAPVGAVAPSKGHPGDANRRRRQQRDGHVRGVVEAPHAAAGEPAADEETGDEAGRLGKGDLHPALLEGWVAEGAIPQNGLHGIEYEGAEIHRLREVLVDSHGAGLHELLQRLHVTSVHHRPQRQSTTRCSCHPCIRVSSDAMVLQTLGSTELISQQPTRGGKRKTQPGRRVCQAFGASPWWRGNLLERQRRSHELVGPVPHDVGGDLLGQQRGPLQQPRHEPEVEVPTRRGLEGEGTTGPKRRRGELREDLPRAVTGLERQAHFGIRLAVHHHTPGVGRGAFPDAEADVERLGDGVPRPRSAIRPEKLDGNRTTDVDEGPNRANENRHAKLRRHSCTPTCSALLRV
mmetsp:Transcript_42989/g.138177  ORF Transcript_42989/g.138177 Transcript_42989/m.138177 type:complete len:429 (+) Transcript_42989:211-1497(+)